MNNFFALCSTILLAVLLNFEQSYGQCSATTCQTPQYSDNAPGTCVLPNPAALDCYFGSTIPSVPQSIPPFWCTTIENNQWFAFTADASFALFDITVFGCSLGGGIQAAVLSTANCNDFTFVSACLGNIIEYSSQSLVASNLTLGQNYYLMIDGNAGAICDFGINIGEAEPPTLIYPTNGQTGVELNVLLQWTLINNANQYLLDVATNPSFSASSIILSQALSGTSLLLEDLQPKTVYYWRLRSVGSCATGGFSQTHAFQTGLLQCAQEFFSTDVPQNIDIQVDSAGTTSAVSTVTVLQSRPILDVNVSLDFEHPRTGDLSAFLISPGNDSILLFDRPGVPGTQFGCTGSSGMLTFDDAASSLAAELELQCAPTPPALNGTFQPIGNLSVLNGKNPVGQWRLEMLDHEVEETGGFIANWGLSFCFFDKIMSGNLLAHNQLTILAGQTDTISQSLLSLDVAPPVSMGVYTLLSLPLNGTLNLNGLPLLVGATFTQEDINSGQLAYSHNANNGSNFDFFHFDAIDLNNCAWIYNKVFLIEIVFNDLVATAVQSQEILCHDASTGQITVTANGLNGEYTYSLNGGPFQSSNVFSGLPAGTYTVVVTGQFELMDTTNAIILFNPAPLNVAAIVDCNAASLVISGGTAPYSSDPSQADLNNLPNGVHVVLVTDNNGCTASTTFSVDIAPFVLSVSSDSILCFGGNTGAITANGSGGCPPYTYSLEGSPFVANNTFSGLSAGPYALAIKDSKGHETSALVTVFQPVLLELSVVITGNTLDATASGGIPPYAYSLNGGLSQSSGLFSDISPGSYTIVVTDMNGCTVSETNLVVMSNTIEVKEVWGVAVSPNPGNGLFRLTTQKAPAQLSAQVYDMTGRLLKSYVLQAENGNLETTLDLQDLPNGNYQMLLSDGKMRGTVKLSKAGK